MTEVNAPVKAPPILPGAAALAVFLRASDAVGTTLLMRRLSLFYSVGFSRPDCQTLVDERHAYRRSRSLPIDN